MEKGGLEIVEFLIELLGHFAIGALGGTVMGLVVSIPTIIAIYKL